MKIAIIGSRDFSNYDLLTKEILKRIAFWDISEVVSGGAKGADLLGRKFAIDNSKKLVEFLPDWSLGRGAGFIRNKKIVEYADIIFAFWDGKSKGTKNSIDTARKLGKDIYIIQYDNIEPKQTMLTFTEIIKGSKK